MSGPYGDVVAAIDFSPASHRVLEHAKGVTGSTGTVHLVHVVEWMPTLVEGTFAGYGNPREMRTIHQASVAKLADFARLCAPLRTTADVVEGNAALSILEIADRYAADVVVIGTHGRTLASRLLLGRVMERVLRHANCPVLVVR